MYLVITYHIFNSDDGKFYFEKNNLISSNLLEICELNCKCNGQLL